MWEDQKIQFFFLQIFSLYNSSMHVIICQYKTLGDFLVIICFFSDGGKNSFYPQKFVVFAKV